VVREDNEGVSRVDGRYVLMPIPPRPFFRSISVYRSIVPPTMYHPRALANSVVVVPSEGLVEISGKGKLLDAFLSEKRFVSVQTSCCVGFFSILLGRDSLAYLRMFDILSRTLWRMEHIANDVWAPKNAAFPGQCTRWKHGFLVVCFPCNCADNLRGCLVAQSQSLLQS
jgi:hypothetical protein